MTFHPWLINAMQIHDAMIMDEKRIEILNFNCLVNLMLFITSKIERWWWFHFHKKTKCLWYQTFKV